MGDASVWWQARGYVLEDFPVFVQQVADVFIQTEARVRPLFGMCRVLSICVVGCWRALDHAEDAVCTLAELALDLNSGEQRWRWGHVEGRCLCTLWE